ncbi:MAG: hypothetical protein K2N09_06755 [Muribaculaceae bacterium]|nr:hypothetical protein [Muribaculaceae bacterium]
MKRIKIITSYLISLWVGFFGYGCSSEPNEPSFDYPDDNSGFIEYATLFSEEKAHYDKLIGLLDDYEKPMRINYRPSIQVRVNSRFYQVGRYRINSY